MMVPDRPAAQNGTPQPEEITAALPVIPDAKFNLADFGGVGDYKTDNTAGLQECRCGHRQGGRRAPHRAGGHL